MKKQLLKKFSTCLPVSMAFIIMVMFFSNANAQIVYTDVIPDTTFRTNGGVYNLDLNNDSITDFRITFNTATSTFGRCGSATEKSILITPLDSNAVGNTSTYPSALNLNAVIDSSSFVWRKNSNQILANLDWSCRFTGRSYVLASTITGNWNGKNDKYLPLQLNLNSQKYYGWLRLDVASNAASFTVNDYAYNTKPKHRIHSGDTSCTTPSDSLTANGTLSICSGNSVQFKAKSNSFYTYQWFKNGNAISGAVSSSYKAFSSGAYYVNVSNSCGRVNSKTDTVSVFAVDTSVTVSGDTLTANATNATYQWIDYSTMQIISGATAKTFLPSQNGSFAVIVSQKGCSDTSSYHTVCIAPTVAITSKGPLSICGGDSVQFNAKTNFFFTYYQWFKDGIAIPGTDSSSYTAFSAGAYYVNVSNSFCNVSSTIDTVSVYEVDVSVTVSGDTLTANAASATYQWIDCNTRHIISGATSQTFLPSQSGNFAVIVTENGCTNTSSCYTVCLLPTLTVRGDTLIADADSATYQWINCSTMQQVIGANAQTFLPPQYGIFAVIVTENGCSRTSSCYIACSPPIISLTSSGPLSICSGDSVKFNVTDDFSYSYEWFKDGNPISGANSSSYSTSGAGKYYVNVRKGCSIASSKVDTLSVFVVDTSVKVSGDTLIANAARAAYQWIDCSTMQIIPGATSQTFLPSKHGSFAVIVTENGCSRTSSCYISCIPLTVTLTSSGPLSICSGESVQFNAITNFSSKYQWFKDGKAISGANSSSYEAFSKGAYYVNVSKVCGNANSTVNTVSVITVDTSVTVKGNGFTANVASATYQWINCATKQIIPGATAQTYLPSQNGSFAVIVTENGCSNTSSCYTSCFAVNTSVTVSGNKLTANAASAKYQWIDCSTMKIIPGATAQTFSPTQNGSFAVIVTDNSCSDTSTCNAIIITGIHENIFASSIAIYPNPASNQLTIDLGSIKQKVGVTITDITGKVMYSIIASDSQKIEVSTQEFKAGIYFVQIQSEDFTITKKLLVEK